MKSDPNNTKHIRMTENFSWDLFEKMPIVGIMRNIAVQHIDTIATIYAESGLTNLEITMNSDQAAETIGRLAKAFRGRLNIGAGTVCTPGDLAVALDAGARFIVTPVIQKEVIKTCVARSIPIFPGAYTPTEIYTAWSLGASMVKVFPATRLGAGYIREVLAPLNQVKLLPTGGVDPENFTDFLKAGARGFGMGSHLFPKQLIEQEDWQGLRALYERLVKKFNSYSQIQ